MIGRTYLLACLALAALSCHAGPIRGLDPKLRPHYTGADGTFRCLDGLKTIFSAQVNDDYCDCFDGSDEPGTSACANGKFYCKNVGHVPLVLNATMVDDGVCDCCDGTDERAGLCANRCKELGAESLRSLEAEVAAAEAGVKAKERYISQAAGIKADWRQRLGQVEGEIAAQETVVQEAQGVKGKLEEEERALLAKKQAAEEAERKAKEAEEAAKGPPPEPSAVGEEAAAAGGEAAAAGGEAAAAGEEAAAADESSREALGGEALADEAPAGEGAAAAEAAAPREETAEEIARRVAAQWIPEARQAEQDAGAGAGASEEEQAPAGDEGSYDELDPELLGEAPGAAAEEEPYTPPPEEDWAEDEEPQPEDEEHVPEAGEYDSPHPAPAAQPSLNDRLQEWASTAKHWSQRMLAKLLNKPEISTPGGAGSGEPNSVLERELQALRKKLQDARSSFHKEDKKLRDLKSEKKGLEDNLGREFGPQDEFVPLADKCFEAKVDKYTYEVCPFKKAAQKEGHSSTSLGSWEGFGEGHGSFKFTGGQSCWQGPARSIEVALRCGAAEELTHVEEPSRCEYHAELATPAACSAEALVALREQLAARKRLLEGPLGEHDEL